MAGLTLEMIAVFAVILVALALFASEALRVDLVAMLVMAGHSVERFTCECYRPDGVRTPCQASRT